VSKDKEIEGILSYFIYYNLLLIFDARSGIQANDRMFKQMRGYNNEWGTIVAACHCYRSGGKLFDINQYLFKIIIISS
jgi:glyceraldehyde-3-phosphate dehydrogenase/erythrose-4-phosphate dehydrogenase